MPLPRRWRPASRWSNCWGGNFRAYAREKLGYQKSQGHRLVQAGLFLQRASPRGDARQLLVSEAHIRPLIGLTDAEQDTVVETLNAWQQWLPGTVVTPKWVEAAVICVRPAGNPKSEPTPNAAVVARVLEVIEELRRSLPERVDKPREQLLAQLEKKVRALAQPPRKTGIEWTGATWNPLHGASGRVLAATVATPPSSWPRACSSAIPAWQRRG